jgi:hypothetical protein
MIDPDSEDLVLLTRAKIPRNPHTATRWRWAFAGVHGPDGPVRLETLKLGGQRYTTPQAVQRFIRACNQPGATPAPPTAAAEKAGADLRGKPARKAK